VCPEHGRYAFLTIAGPIPVKAPVMAPKFLQKIINKIKGNGGGPTKPASQGSGPAQDVVQTSKQASDSTPSIPGFAVVWSDEFNGPAGAAVNANNWLSYTGPVYNNEIER
jgi:hypothetical protein